MRFIFETPKKIYKKEGIMRVIFVMVLFLLTPVFIVSCGGSLHQAINQNDYLSVEKSIQEGADVNMKSSGWTPLMKAAYHGNVKIVEYLIKQGADLDIRAKVEPHPAMQDKGSGNNLRSDFIGFTALYFAAFYGNTEAAKALIDSGADLSIQDDKGYTAYDHARQYGFKDIIQYIERAKKDAQ